jgi:hypothetical protein
MKRTFLPILIVAVIAAVVVVVAVSAGWLVVWGDGRLVRAAAIVDEQISPNADGVQDATLIEYEISRSALVSIYFENEAGERFYFRRDQPRGAGEYRVLFSGVVEGYRLPGEIIQGEIVERLLQDGRYTWTVEATDETGYSDNAQGTLIVANASRDLPEMRGFEMDRHIFSPNRDGIDDRVKIQFDLQKEAHVRLFLLTDDGIEMPIPRLERELPAGMPGRHYYDYEGGVDQDALPPPDGTYPIIAIAEDREGQKIRVEEELTIRFGGVPRADIISPASGDTVAFSGTAVALCDTLTFTLTLHNYGAAPIRTTGPATGTVYDSNWNYNTIGWSTESGAWRVGIGYENQLSDYPYRWAIGDYDQLEEIDGHYYLMPGQRAVVTGGVRIVSNLGARNPQPVWAGLIHEDVRISQFNDRVGVKAILIDLPDPDHIEPCPARPLPER